MIGHKETDFGEPKVYGGYGSGANAEQREAVAYEECEGKTGKGVKVVDWRKRYPSVKAAAKALGVDEQALGRKLRRNNGRTVVNGVVVELA